MISILSCRMARSVIRLLGRGGTNIPGMVALKINPNILKEMSRGVKIIIVTGTNGKTTTSRMIGKCLEDAGVTYVSNPSGANLIQGITADFADHSTITGKCKCEYAVIECDEGAFKQVSLQTDPVCVVVTNVFADQLDRYGDIAHTLEAIKTGCQNSKNAVLCLNADCSMTASIAAAAENKCLFYGINTEVYKTRVKEVSDAPNCLSCGAEYAYDYVTYGHLGGWYCPVCGYRRPEPDVAVTEVILSDSNMSRVRMNIGLEEKEVDINLPGAYNIYNAASCAAAMKACGFDSSITLGALATFNCAFGRMERLAIPNTDIRMILIKNTAGCNQVLNFLTDMTEKSLFVIGLNDKINDGTDISWINDVDFEKLNDMGDTLSGVYVTGIRADDMAERLKKAGLSEDKIITFHDYDKLIDEIVKADMPVYIMPNYTVMLDLRAKLARRYKLKEFWE